MDDTQLHIANLKAESLRISQAASAEQRALTPNEAERQAQISQEIWHLHEEAARIRSLAAPARDLSIGSTTGHKLSPPKQMQDLLVEAHRAADV